jgi:uncharacterized protein (UPF0212 family)
MERCPKCGQWTFALNTQRSVMTCRLAECNFEKTVNAEEYLIKDNALPKLILSIKVYEARK